MNHQKQVERFTSNNARTYNSNNNNNNNSAMPCKGNQNLCACSPSAQLKSIRHSTQAIRQTSELNLNRKAAAGLIN